MQRTLHLAIPLLFLAMPIAAQAQLSEQPAHQPLSSADKDFLTYAAKDNHAEIEACLLGENKAVDQAVKAFSRLMVDDHVQIASHLALLANTEGFEVPNGIGQEGQETMSKMQALEGKNFDRQFMQHQVTDHEHDLQKLRQIESQTQNNGVRRYVWETYPILQQHLALAKAVASAIDEQSKRAAR